MSNYMLKLRCALWLLY